MNEQKKDMDLSREITKKEIGKKTKGLFLIINLVVAIISFSYGISLVMGQGEAGVSLTTPESIFGGGGGGTANLAQPFPSSALNPTVGYGATLDFTGAIPPLKKIPEFFATITPAVALFLSAGVGAIIGAIDIGGIDGVLIGAGSFTLGYIIGSYVIRYLGILPGSLPAGLIIATISAAIYYFAKKFLIKTNEVKVDFICKPWQAPLGGRDCEKCNVLEVCSEYACKSLGQACEIVNKGTEDQKCVWKNPTDVNSPIIEFIEAKDHQFKPDLAVRPPATGVEIHKNNNCIEAFTPLEFTFKTNEPAQCKIDNNLTLSFEEMNFFVAGNSLFLNNHTERLSLPGPNSINNESPELKNDGTYNLYVRCLDANGNFNQDPFSVKFCVNPGPDTTAPRIESTSILSNSPIAFNKTSLNLEVYVNEPSECKWSRSNVEYNLMENNMNCDRGVFQMNNLNLYTCRTNLTGIEDRKDNQYYFRCKDQPNEIDSKRNVNTQSYLYAVKGTQPLNILSLKPKNNQKIFGSTDAIQVNLEVITDNGFDNGISTCYYSISNEQNFIQFFETKTNNHKQRQDLPTGTYNYFIKCLDAGGNTVVNATSFSVETDRTAPRVVRVYRETGLKVITDESAECSYSNLNCNFEIESGIKMTLLNVEFTEHSADWNLNKNYYIRCKDAYDNQPSPNACSIIVRPSQIDGSNAIVL